MLRETNRFGNMNKTKELDMERIETRKELYKAGSKNHGGAAFNIVTLDYDTNKEGKILKNLDNDAMVRALMRSKVLDQKNNGEYNILTGTGRPPIPVPSHNRYNPISKAGAAVMSNGSRRSQAQQSEAAASRRSLAQ